MSDERLKLVTDFAELRVGMLVVDIACAYCRGWCQGRLRRLEDAETGLAWSYGGPCAGFDGEDNFSGIDAPMVAARRIFRLADAADDARAAERPREKARTR